MEGDATPKTGQRWVVEMSENSTDVLQSEDVCLRGKGQSQAAGRRTTATKVGVVCARFARSRNCKGACENFAGVTYDESAGMHDIYLPFINT